MTGHERVTGRGKAEDNWKSFSLSIWEDNETNLGKENKEEKKVW